MTDNQLLLSVIGAMWALLVIMASTILRSMSTDIKELKEDMKKLYMIQGVLEFYKDEVKKIPKIEKDLTEAHKKIRNKESENYR